MSKQEAATAKEKKVPNKTPVTLTTGEVVEFGDRQKMLKESALADGKATVKFMFRNGEVREFHFDKHHELLMRLAIHGAMQKIGDEASGIDAVEDQVAAVDSLIARLAGGNWGVERQAGGSSFAGASIVVRAIGEVTGKTPAEVAVWVEGKLKAFEAAGKPITRQALYQSFRAPGSKTAPIIARLEAEAAAKRAAKADGPKADDLLGELEA